MSFHVSKALATVCFTCVYFIYRPANPKRDVEFDVKRFTSALANTRFGQMQAEIDLQDGFIVRLLFSSSRMNLATPFSQSPLRTLQFVSANVQIQRRLTIPNGQENDRV